MARKPHPDPAPAEPAVPAGPADLARAAVGVHGDSAVPSWREATTPRSRRRVLDLQLLAASEWASLVGLIVLVPAIAVDEGWSRTNVSAMLLLAGVVYAFAGLFGVGLPDARRVRTIQLFAVNGAIVTVLIGFAPGMFLTLLLLLVRGALGGLHVSASRPLLHDAVAPEARTRAVGRVSFAGFLGAAFGALMAASTVAGPDLDTGTGLLLLGVAVLVLSLSSLLLTDPGVGGAEPERLARAFGGDRRYAALSTPMRDAVPRVLNVHTVRTSLTANVTAGALSIGLVSPWLTAVLSIPSDDGDDPITVGTALVVLASVLAVSGLVVAVVSRNLEKSRRRSLDGLMRSAWLEPVILGGIAMLGIALIEGNPMMLTVALAFALVGGGIAKAALDVGTLSVVTPSDRGVVAALTNVSWAFGGVLAALLTSWRADEAPRAGFVILMLLLVAAALINRRIVQQPDADLDATLPIDAEQIIAETPVEAATGLAPEVSPYAYVAPPAEVLDTAGQAPLLSAEKVSFAYGSVQVLFDVDLVVRPGELVALLGPNGVGKTTLLRCLSGLELPQQGVVRLDGTDITKMSPSRRVTHGISQIVGGNAVFGTLSVAENLQMYGYSVGKDRKAVQAGIAQAYEVFPTLADRRNQLGSTLSGGEQQMLGLSKALITNPKLLVVDEFSLGLAPVIVAELLSMVRALNANGTAVLLVEQSVNVALNLVDRCYFMEKGRVVHEGSAEALRAQPELVQALSLGGLPTELSETTA